MLLEQDKAVALATEEQEQLQKHTGAIAWECLAITGHRTRTDANMSRILCTCTLLHMKERAISDVDSAYLAPMSSTAQTVKDTIRAWRAWIQPEPRTYSLSV